MKKIPLGIIACLLLASSGTAQIVSSFTDTFTPGSDISGYVATSAETSFTLSGGDIITFPTFDDGDLIDALNDGFASLSPTATGGSVGLTHSLGTIAAGDVGSVIDLDVTYQLANASNLTTNYDINVGGGSVSSFDINTFGAGNDPGGAIGQLSIVNGGNALSYTIQAGDVGQELSFSFGFFVGGSGGSRILEVDAVSLGVAPIPEPQTYALIAGSFFLLYVMILRRRR